jgi:hypothetical protein
VADGWVGIHCFISTWRAGWEFTVSSRPYTRISCSQTTPAQNSIPEVLGLPSLDRKGAERVVRRVAAIHASQGLRTGGPVPGNLVFCWISRRGIGGHPSSAPKVPTKDQQTSPPRLRSNLREKIRFVAQFLLADCECRNRPQRLEEAKPAVPTIQSTKESDLSA